MPRAAAPDAMIATLRHPWPVRLWHWVNAVGITLSLLTGCWIFNVHPRLYWGEDGHAGMPAVLSLEAVDAAAKPPRFELQVGGSRWDVTPLMGVIDVEGSDQYTLVGAYPKDYQFGASRTWHFLAAWMLVGGWLTYGLYLIGSGRLRRMWWPGGGGARAASYNVVQQLAYLALFALLIPTLILSGLTLSNSVTAAHPELFALWGGRQSARTVHFGAAATLAFFVAVHLYRVLVCGFFPLMRSMVTGRRPAAGGEGT